MSEVKSVTYLPYVYACMIAGRMASRAVRPINSQGEESKEKSVMKSVRQNSKDRRTVILKACPIVI